MNDKPRSFLITTWEGGGSVAPALTVARKLAARGHRVRVMSDACNRSESEAAGAEFVSWTRAPNRANRDPAGDLRDWDCEGPAGLLRVIEALWTGPALAYAEDVIAELRRQPADLVLTSEMLFGVTAGCEAIDQPFAYLTCNISLFPLPGVPPLGPGLAPPRTEAERAMQAEIHAGVIGLFDHGLPALNAARRALGLAPLAHTVDQGEAAVATLMGTARAFDFAPKSLPPNVHYIGPQLDEPAWAEPWTSPWGPDDARPLVLVGFSTTFQNHARVLQTVIDAAADLPIRLLVTLGGSIAADALSPAGNTRIVESAPHDVVMREAALVVTHGGHGTVARALCHRLPLLLIPHGRDQNDNAVRVTERGAGLCAPSTASVEEIRAALVRLLEDRAFTRAADTLGAAVAREAAESPVVELVERLVRAEADFCPA